jgi:3'-phosphoadenosine 5'-phosphosulfate sulfotransferase (PAPS reductase)/FAD synthetase
VQAKRGGMVEHILQRAGFPARMQRWCTQELKIEPLRAWHNTIERWLPGRETVCVVGIRAEESEARAKMLTWEDDDQWGGWMWRPILAWTIEDVLTIHHRHGVPLNPLYRRGHDRVGCFPCIMSRKEEVRLIAEQAPERIDLIRSLERDIALERASRNATTPGRYKHPIGTFFQSVDRDGAGVMPIDDVVTWARTERGGRQLPMFDADPTGGCFRWGMCEPPKAAE